MAYLSDTKPGELTALTSLATDDVIVVGDTSDASEVAKGITKANLITDLTTSFATAGHNHTGVYAPVLGADDNYVTDAEKTKLSNIPEINVKDYGAVGDDSTDDYAAITAAITASNEGDIIYFPAGIYLTSAPITLKRNRTYRGTHSPRWFYRGGDVCSIKPHATFSGDQILYIPDKEITADASDNDGGRIENICVNGNSAGSTIIGIRFHGLVRDWVVKDIDVSQTSGNGFSVVGYTRIDTNTYYPRGLNFSFVSVYSAGNNGGTGNGFVFNQSTDSTFTNCLAVDCESIGFLIDSPGETKFVDCRSVFNNSDGFRVTGASTVGGVQFIGCSTDRNGKYGIQITATGDQPIQIIGMLNRRDGSTATGNLAGVGIVGTVGNTVCPVNIYGLDQTIGYDDGGGGTQSPAYGVYSIYSQQVTATGTAWGVTAGVYDGGNNTIANLIFLKQKTGTSSTYDTTPYHGNLGVGVQDALKRIHVKDSSSNAGVRTENTTNSVIGEIRSDTSQFFIGTISNHDLRLFTNGVSRVAITSTTIQPNTDDAIALGNATSNRWSDLYLAEGGVINWDNGDATLTQTGNVVKLAGAALETDGVIELGHATDTTLSRVSAGVVAVEGVTVPTISSTNTLTNKRRTRRLSTTNAPGATPTTNTDNVDVMNFTGLGTAITSMTTNLSGTPVDGDLLEFRFTDDGTARAITWGASFAATTVALPTTTVISTMLRVGFEYSGSTWKCIAVA